MGSGIRIKHLLLLMVAFIPLHGFAQDEHNEHNDHNHRIHHLHAKNEVSLGAGIVWLPMEEALSPGLNLHYVRGIGLENRFGIGASAETILDEHRHLFLAVVLQMNVFEGVKISYAPGVLLGSEENTTQVQFAHHVEITREWEIGRLHLGPMVGVGKAKDDWHFMIGLHTGIGF